MAIEAESKLTVTGGLNYTNPPLFRYVDRGDVAAVLPPTKRQMRWRIAFVYGVMLVTALVATAGVRTLKPTPEAYQFLQLFWVMAVVMACVFHAVLIAIANRGPTLVLKRADLTLSLPQQKRVLPLGDVVRFEVVTGTDRTPAGESIWVAELHARMRGAAQSGAASIAIVGAAGRHQLEPIADALNRKLHDWTATR